MPGEYDAKFDEITGILQKMQRSVGLIDELTMEVRDLRTEVRDVRTEIQENSSGLRSLNQKVEVLSGQFQDVGVMAIEDHKRIDGLGLRVDALETEAH
ncbi:hypothetical protein BH20ACI2_BH20ACI2_16380 [soil metagenome]